MKNSFVTADELTPDRNKKFSRILCNIVQPVSKVLIKINKSSMNNWLINCNNLSQV